MRKASFFIFLIFFTCIHAISALTPRYSAIVIDADSGAVLEQEDADTICHPASLTKMATLYMVFEALKSGRIRMDTQVPVSAHAARQIPSKLGLRPGEYVSIETIVKGLVTKSANDASAAVAEYLGGSEANFAAQMTRKARSLGMRKTIFKNASGVPNPYQITTARDMAILSRALYRDFPKDYRHFRTQSFYHRGQVHRNHNRLLGKVPGLDGIKTGYVAASGFNLAASAVRKGLDSKPKRLIAVVLGGANRHWRDQRVANLLETNFQKIGLGHSPSIREEEEEDEDTRNVIAFLKKEVNKKSRRKDPSQLVPISITWPPPPSNAPKQQAVASDDWGVQLGTYRSLSEAKQRARKMLIFFKKAEISTPKIAKGKKSFYGARLVGLSRKEAETLCRKYAPKNKECRILSAG